MTAEMRRKLDKARRARPPSDWIPPNWTSPHCRCPSCRLKMYEAEALQYAAAQRAVQ